MQRWRSAPPGACVCVCARALIRTGGGEGVARAARGVVCVWPIRRAGRAGREGRCRLPAASPVQSAYLPALSCQSRMAARTDARSARRASADRARTETDTGGCPGRGRRRQSRSRSSTKVDQSAPGRAGVPGLAQLSRSAVHGPLSGSANSSKVLKTPDADNRAYKVGIFDTFHEPGEEHRASCWLCGWVRPGISSCWHGSRGRL